MIIVIASGKGGTGKTTIATNLAAALPGPIRFLDCDVEEPNAHLFLKPVILSEKRVDTMVPVVDQLMCDLCGACHEVCQFSAILPVGDSVMVFPELCHSCRGCVEVCPQKAIKDGRRQLGEIIHGKSGTIDLYYGRLRVGEAMSPPLIRRVKNNVADEEVNVIDAPPGTSCPVAATLRGADFVVLVTEPTPFGLNDLKLAVESVRMLSIPMGIVINQSDIGDDRIKQYAEKERISILLEIPHQREIAESYSKGVLMIDAIPEMKKSFLDLFGRIRQLVSENKRLQRRAG